MKMVLRISQFHIMKCMSYPEICEKKEGASSPSLSRNCRVSQNDFVRAR
jgi:hypothetical protein